MIWLYWYSHGTHEPVDWRWVAGGVVAFYAVYWIGWLIFRERP